MEINIPTPVPPTEEEMIDVATRWWKHQYGVNFLEWYPALRDVSYPIRVVKLPVSLIDKILSLADSQKAFIEVVNECYDIINPELKKLGCEKSFFIKLITRSPKDFLLCKGSFELKSVRDAVEAISSSMRCFDDLCLLRYIDMGYVFIRPYINIDKSQEWRVFIEDQKIVGISQYYYDENFTFIRHKMVYTEASIRHFVNEIVIPNMKVKSFIADVVVDDLYRPTLLETNPFGLSDPCLFKDYESLDGSFLYNK